jgi:hypothetical protein
VDFALWIGDYLNDAIQMVTFAEHHDYMFASGCAGIFALSSYIFMKNEGTQDCTPWTSMRQSLLQGRLTDAWFDALLIERMFEAPFNGLLSPYGMSLQSSLSRFQASSACVGLLLSVKAVAQAHLDCHDCMLKPEACRALAPWKVRGVFAWRILGAVAELSAFAISARVFHPCVAIVTHLPNFAITFRTLRSNGRTLDYDFLSGLFMNTIYGKTEAVCIWRLNLNLDNPYAMLACAVLRFVFCTSLCLLVDLPHGIGPWWSLQRPMGSAVFREVFIQPSLIVLEAAWPCLTSLMHYASSDDVICHIRRTVSTVELTDGSIFFNAFLLFITLLSIPMYVVASIFNLACNPIYARQANTEFRDAVDDKQEEIDTWGVRRERRTASAVSER